MSTLTLLRLNQYEIGIHTDTFRDNHWLHWNRRLIFSTQSHEFSFILIIRIWRARNTLTCQTIDKNKLRKICLRKKCNLTHFTGNWKCLLCKMYAKFTWIFIFNETPCRNLSHKNPVKLSKNRCLTIIQWLVANIFASGSSKHSKAIKMEYYLFAFIGSIFIAKRNLNFGNEFWFSRILSKHK